MKQEQNVFFSIITVCLNAEKMIRKTMESVLNQTWQNFEYIIIDGLSTDATLAIVQELAENDKRIQWISELDSGIFNAMNKGIHRARGSYLLFLNAGDEFHSKDVLEKAAKVVEGADIVIGDIACKTEAGLEEVTYPVDAELLENLRKGKSVCHQTIFASKRCLEDGFDENFMFCADYDWLCRQVNAGRKVVKLNAVVVDFDMHGVTFQVRYQKRHWKEYFEVIGKNFSRLEFKYGEEVKNLFIQQRKEHIMYEFMNRWLELKQRGVELSTFFSRQRIQTIAIYGIHHVGERLYDELKESEVKVAYFIDRNPKMLEIPVLRPDEILDQVDAVVITPIFDFLEIKDSLSAKLDCPMFFIEDVLFYEYEAMEKDDLLDFV
ncbi:MAG: glycosyltransferase [Lachnospiraceae bacterium]|nr:glycosyltransferase [Lachnospiraceae bacterium]